MPLGLGICREAAKGERGNIHAGKEHETGNRRTKRCLVGEMRVSMSESLLEEEVLPPSVDISTSTESGRGRDGSRATSDEAAGEGPP